MKKDNGKNGFLKRIIGAAGVAAIGFIGVTHLYDGLTQGRKLAFNKVDVNAPKLPKELDGYKIAFISDVHYYSEERLGEAILGLNAYDVDIILIGGDFARFERGYRSLEIISKGNQKDGIYAIDGNHDQYKTYVTNLRRLGINYLGNRGKLVRDGLYIGGVRDYRSRKPNVERALRGAGENSFNILLSHNPDITLEEDVSKADLTICGHTHGGEMKLFGKWAPLLEIRLPGVLNVTRYRQYFNGGWANSGSGTPVYVGKGVGGHGPFRVFCQAEIVIFRLYSDEE